MENLDKIVEIAAGGVVAIWILREVFGFLVKLKSKTNENESHSLQLQKLQIRIEENQDILKSIAAIAQRNYTKTDELHRWHSIEEPGTGVKVWYTQSIKEEIKDMNEILSKIEKTLGDKK